MATLWLHDSLEKKKPKRRTIFKPSERLEEMSKPKKKLEPIQNNAPYRVKKSALRYKCTPRIEKLALPLERQYWEPPKLKESELCVSSNFKIPRRALRARSTARIIQLAQPKNIFNKSYIDIRLKRLEEKEDRNRVKLQETKASEHINLAKKIRPDKCSKSVEAHNQDGCRSKNAKKHKTTETSKCRKLQIKYTTSLGIKAESRLFTTPIP